MVRIGTLSLLIRIGSKSFVSFILSRFTLMTLIIASLEENLQVKGNDEKMVDLVKSLLSSSFDLHQDTIEYWRQFEEDNPDNYWMVTPIMRAIWQENKA